MKNKTNKQKPTFLPVVVAAWRQSKRLCFYLSVSDGAGNARFFSQSKLFSSLSMVCLNTAGLLLSIISFRKDVRVLNFSNRTNCPSLLLSVSFSFLRRPLPSCCSTPLPARIFLTPRYTVARAMPVHFGISFGLSVPPLNSSERTNRVFTFHFPPSVTESVVCFRQEKITLESKVHVSVCRRSYPL